jgi:SAM-dependent methyltransferase
MAKKKRIGSKKRRNQPRMPERLGTGNIPTLNGYGTSFPDLVIKDDFIRDAAQNSAWALDIGCAYGLHTLEAIKSGARVVANDLDPRHLQILQQQLPNELSLNLRVRTGAFQSVSLPASSIGCILAGYVLHFLDGRTLDRVIKKMHRVLRNGGKVYANVWSPYIKPLQDLIPEFERRKAANERWPGYFKGIEGRMGPLMPNEIHTFDLDVISEAFKRHGFIVEKCEYVAMSAPGRGVDGREMVIITARKP